MDNLGILVMATNETYLTQEGLIQLQDELKSLKTYRRPELAAGIRKALENGGDADNAEYDEIKNQQGIAEGRIIYLEDLLAKATVAPKNNGGKSDIISFGSSITVQNETGGKQKYTIVGSAESAPLENKISIESPVGSSLIGHKVGDKITIKTPSGKSQLKIIKIH